MQQAAIPSEFAIDWSIYVSVLLTIAVTVLAVVLIGKLKRVRNLQKLAHGRGVRLVELIRLLDMAEDSAGLGVWHYYPSLRRQEWSGGMKRLFGLEREVELLEGDAETLLASNGIDLVAHVMDRQVGRVAETSQFTIRRWDGSRRILKLQACHLNEGKGETDHILGVLADVTHRERDAPEADCTEKRVNRFLAPIKPVHLVERHRLMGKLGQHIMRFRSNGTPVSLLVIELGGGAIARKDGCERLRGEIGMVAQEGLRSNDIFCWLGGNEFAWLAAGADEHFAKLMAERLLCTFGLAGAAGPFSGSAIDVGIASAREGDTALSLFARADGSLHRSKAKPHASLTQVA